MARYLCDAMLGRLTRWLRLLGHDAAYSDADDDALLARCRPPPDDAHGDARDRQATDGGGPAPHSLPRDSPRRLYPDDKSSAQPGREATAPRRLLARCRPPPDDKSSAQPGREATAPRRLLTRDRELAARAGVAPIIADDLCTQLAEVAPPRAAPFTRCTACNGLLRAASAEEAARAPPLVREPLRDIRVCGECGQLYWPGTHTERIARMLRECGLLD